MTLKYNAMSHWYVCTLTLQSSLHSDSTISSFNAFWSAPRAKCKRWLNWMSLPNKLKCSHTVITLRFTGNLLCMNHKFVYVPCGVVRLEWERRRDNNTTDAQIVCFTRPRHSRYIYIFCFSFFSFKNVLKMEGDDVFGTFECFLCACWSCSHFSTNWKANCSEVDACS